MNELLLAAPSPFHSDDFGSMSNAGEYTDGMLTDDALLPTDVEMGYLTLDSIPSSSGRVVVVDI